MRALRRKLGYLALGTAMSCAGCVVMEFPIAVEIHADRPTGPVPSIFNFGVDTSQWGVGFTETYALRKIRRENRVRLYRTGMSIAFNAAQAESLEEYLQIVKTGFDAEVAAAKADGAEVIFTIVGTPKFLSPQCTLVEGKYKCTSNRPDWDDYLNAPPKDYKAWTKLVYSVVNHFKNELKLDLLYEIGNEPDLIHFWTGTEAQWLDLYRASVIGAQYADKNVRVGGPGVSEWNHLTENFLAYCGARGLPVHFVSWHNYAAWNAWGYTSMTSQIKTWLTANGFPETTPLIIDEWNFGPNMMQPGEHDTEFNAAYIAYALVNMYRGGITHQTFFQLQDFANAPRFGGGYMGVINTSGVQKPGYHSLGLVSRLAGADGEAPRLLEVSEPPDVALRVVSSQSQDGKTTRVLVSHFIPAFAYVSQDLSLPSPTREVTIRISGLLPGTYTLKKSLIDRDHSNSCLTNKRSESTPSESICGSGGLIDRQIDAALSSSGGVKNDEYYRIIGLLNQQEGVSLSERSVQVSSREGTYIEVLRVQPYSVLLLELTRH